ncbi:hypothetical protein [Streptomyces venezuelae]|uniref:hypothetical protein n=1 Tax=Streptomyces venezuelae TaxID=54571 RepID=UPI00378CEB31
MHASLGVGGQIACIRLSLHLATLGTILPALPSSLDEDSRAKSDDGAKESS